MHGSLDPEERIFEPNSTAAVVPDWYTQIVDAVTKLEWLNGDEISIEIGGTAVSGIDVGEVYNKKWQSPKGTRKYNKDAFIIIKNQSRRDLTKSQPMEEFKPQHESSNNN